MLSDGKVALCKRLEPKCLEEIRSPEECNILWSSLNGAAPSLLKVAPCQISFGFSLTLILPQHFFPRLGVTGFIAALFDDDRGP
jgi:hypothetical protein